MQTTLAFKTHTVYPNDMFALGFLQDTLPQYLGEPVRRPSAQVSTQDSERIGCNGNHRYTLSMNSLSSYANLAKNPTPKTFKAKSRTRARHPSRESHPSLPRAKAAATCIDSTKLVTTAVQLCIT